MKIDELRRRAREAGFVDPSAKEGGLSVEQLQKAIGEISKKANVVGAEMRELCGAFRGAFLLEKASGAKLDDCTAVLRDDSGRFLLKSHKIKTNLVRNPFSATREAYVEFLVDSWEALQAIKRAPVMSVSIVDNSSGDVLFKTALDLRSVERLSNSVVGSTVDFAFGVSIE